MTLRLGTRGSALALAQSRAIADRLGADVVVIESDGDRMPGSLASLGGTGVFATALRTALRAGEVDVVVHSFKDLPTAAEPGLAIAAVPERADVRDAFVGRGGASLAELAPGARVGTGSPRRRAQLLARRPDLDVVDLRGNVDTRLARVSTDDPERRLDGVVLAAAGLHRLGRLGEASELFAADDWPPAPAQGALAVETRADETAAAAALDDPVARVTADAERRLLALLEAGCAAPVGAHATVAGDDLVLSARVYALDGSAVVSATATVATVGADAAERVAAAVVADLLAQGAADLAPLGGRA